MKKSRNYTITIYCDTKGEWRWRLRAPNGRITADGGEGYVGAREAKRAVKTLVTKLGAGHYDLVELKL